jgi:hypothetical protein
MSPMPAVRDETATLLRRLLAEVSEGRLEAPGAAGERLIRRMEGAAAALEVAPPRESARRPKSPGHRASK